MFLLRLSISQNKANVQIDDKNRRRMIDWR